MHRILSGKQSLLGCIRCIGVRVGSSPASARLQPNVQKQSFGKKQNKTRNELYSDLIQVLEHRVQQLQKGKRAGTQLSSRAKSPVSAASDVKVKSKKEQKDTSKRAAATHVPVTLDFDTLLSRYITGLEMITKNQITSVVRRADMRELAADVLYVLKQVRAVTVRQAGSIQKVATSDSNEAAPAGKKLSISKQVAKQKLEQQALEHDTLVFLTRVERFNEELDAYVYACLLQDEFAHAQAVVDAAQRFVAHSSSYGLLNGYVVRDRILFDRLIAYAAPRGDYAKLGELITMMRVGAVRLDYETVASCLETIGYALRSRTEAERIVVGQSISDPANGTKPSAPPVRASDVRQLLNYAATQIDGFKLSNLPLSCKRFRPSERVQAIVSAAKLVDSTFEWQVSSSIQRHQCTLLRNYLDYSYSGDANSSTGALAPKQQPFSVNPHAGALSIDELRRNLDRQLHIELNDGITMEGIAATWSDVESSNTSKHSRSSSKAKKSVSKQKTSESKQDIYSKQLDKLRSEWRGRLAARFSKAVSEARAQEKKRFSDRNAIPRLGIAPFLTIFDTSWYVDLLLQEAENLTLGGDSYSLPLRQLHRNIAIRLMNKAFCKHKHDCGYIEAMRNYYNAYLDQFATRQQMDKSVQLPRQAFEKLINGPIEFELRVWPWAVLRQVGKSLYDLLLDAARFDVRMFGGQLDDVPQEMNKTSTHAMHYQPAFFTVFRYYGSQVHCEVKTHPVLLRALSMTKNRKLHFETTDLPMLVPPVPWQGAHTGGYFYAPLRLIRSTDSHWQESLSLLRQHSGDANYGSRQVARTSLEPSLDALNVLGGVPWRINKPMLDIAMHIFLNKGDRSLGIPVTESCFPPAPIAQKSMTKREVAAVKRETAGLMKEKQEMYSLWTYELYRLSIASKYADDVFWLPHNMDFRSRVYPAPPHFNHMNGDLARSILKFAKGKPLGPTGLDWLKIHCINLTGLKKTATLKERLEYANSLMDDIIDSAERPLNGKGWWRNDEDPWQTLACCMEIRDALRSPDPTRFISHLPVHQDGSCNGSQHYAALGRDALGASAVNISPSDSPQDLYGRVTELVEQKRASDAARGVEIAKSLAGIVRRKVIKQPIMTSVYGVTAYGARLQVEKQLKELENFDKSLMLKARDYLVTQTFASFGELFVAASRIQRWLVDCAHVISNYRGLPVQWITPLGLPVVQPYYKIKQQATIARPTLVMPGSSKFVTPDHTVLLVGAPNVSKQKNAFPPNFIHSLDSSHMMLTALECWKRGITFVSVHDCFWTHASDVDEMNAVLRQAFYNLHSQPILRDLSNYLHATYSFSSEEWKANAAKASKMQETLSAVPPVGTFDLRKVLDSPYFFS